MQVRKRINKLIFIGRQKLAGRNVRKSPLWDKCSAKGAFFGLGGGHWEVPKFYMPGSDMPVKDYDW